MFQPQSTPFAASFYGGVGVSASMPSQTGYESLSLDLPPGGSGGGGSGGRGSDDLAPAFGFTPAAPGGPPNRDMADQTGYVDGGVVAAGDLLLNNKSSTSGGAGGRGRLGRAVGGSSSRSGFPQGPVPVSRVQITDRQGQPQHLAGEHLLYSSASPIALAHRTGAHGRLQQQQQQQQPDQMAAQQMVHPPHAASAAAAAHHAARARQHLSHATTSSPNHHPSPPSHTLPHHNPNAPIAHFVPPASSCNQQRVNYNTSNNTYSIPSPAGSAASSSNNLSAVNDRIVHPSYSATTHQQSNPISIATPAASTPSTRARSADMAGDATSESAFQDELVAQQRAAESYQPQLEGPVIGEKRPSDVITEEYAKADPFYVEKTVNLPQTYSHFRPVQGDGNCGWRAIGFSYFEHLVLAGDPEKLHHEVARLTSLNNYLSNCGGYDLELFEDMVLETITLLKDLAQTVPDTQTAMALLMQRFNDRDCSNAIVYHLRLLAGAWLKGNAADYEPFLDAGGDVRTWAHLNIEVPDKEIDHLSIMLLSSILLKPIGFVLEIAYLDRTPGSLVNTYRFPDETNGQDPMSLGPIIYLLFRPDHYDILYKDPAETVTPAPAPAPVSLQVNRAASFSHHHQITSHPPTSLHNFATLDYSSLAMLPGFCGPTPGLSPLTASSPTSPMHDAYGPSAQASWMQTPYPEPQLQQTIPPPPPPLAAAGPTPTPTQSTPPPASTSSSGPTKANQPVDYQLRFSSQCFHLKNPTGDSSLLPQSPFPEPSFTTTMFKNSHFNKAHYNNPHFHPEEWTPDDEPTERCVGGFSKKKSRVKSEH